MKKYDRFDVENIGTTTQLLEKSDLQDIGLEPLLFQTGYLTIKEKDFFTSEIVLDYPNKEVRSSFYNYLMNNLANKGNKQNSGATILDFSRSFKKGDLQRVRLIIETTLSDLPYQVFDKQTEGLYHGLIHILFKYLDIYVRSEVHTRYGRLDSLVETDTDIYIFEFKFDKSAKEAIAQIKTKGYANGFYASGKKITAIGVNFGTKEQSVVEWLEEELSLKS